MASNEEKNREVVEESGVTSVTPVDSPSENYLVVEHLQQMPNIFARGLVYLMVLLMLVALLYSSLAKIDIVVECQAVARPASHKIKILSDRDGYIVQIFVSEGDHVEKGTPLFLMRSKETIAYTSRLEELRQTIPLKEQSYDMKISVARDQLRRAEAQHRNALRVMALRLEQNKLSLVSAESELAYLEKEANRLSEEVTRAKELFEKGLTSVAEYDRMESELERVRTEVQKQISQKSIVLKQKSIIEEEIAEETSNHENDRAILEKEVRSIELEKEIVLQSMQSELAMNKSMLSITEDAAAPKGNVQEKGSLIRAEKAGMVSELYFQNEGEYVTVADLLCTIVPADSPLYMHITVANKDIGFIDKGMEIKYKLDAFPYANYGTLPGKVLAVSPSAVGNMATGYVYQVRGTLDREYFEIRGKRYPIKAGMTATAELVTEKRSIFSILFGKLKK